MEEFNLLKTALMTQQGKFILRFALLLLILSHSLTNSFSQGGSRENVKIDSLQKQLRLAKNDTLRDKILIEIEGHFNHGALSAAGNGQYEIAYNAFWNIFDLLNDQESQNQRTLRSLLTNNTFNYGLLMGLIGNREEQKAYFRKSYQLAKQWNDTINLVYTRINMALAFKQENKLDSAEYYLNNALAFDPSHKPFYFFVFYIAGEIKLDGGEYESSKELFIKGIDNAKRFDSDLGLAANFLGLSKVYKHLNDRDSSYYYGVRSLKLLKTIKEIQYINIDLASGYENMFEHFQQVERQDSAFYYLKLASKERAFFSNKKIKDLAAFQQVLLKKQLLLKDLQREKIETQARIRSYVLLSVLLFFVIVGSVFLFSYRRKQKANKVLETTLNNLKSTQSQLIQSEKMASLGELTAGIAHEIQNPLNFVNNFSEVCTELIDEMKTELETGNVQMATEISNDLKQNLEKINHHGKRAADIVKGMLQHSRSSSGVREPTDINALADEYLRLAYHGLRAKDKSFNATMKTDFDESIGNINVIPQDIGRVILNLINNAFYVVNEKFKQNIAGYEPTVSVSTKKDGNKVLISVKDNGNGIPQKILDKIFQPFFTTKPTGQGTGLGLSLSYDIVKAHGGEIKVSTKENEGTEFIVQIPNQ